MIMVAVEPAANHKFSGSDISGQEQVKRLWETGRPVISSVFMSVEGFPALDLEWPVFPASNQDSYQSLEGRVFNRQDELIGSVSLLIKQELLCQLCRPRIAGTAAGNDGHAERRLHRLRQRHLPNRPQCLYRPLLSGFHRGYLTRPGEQLPKGPGLGPTLPGSGPLQKQVLKRSVWTTVGLHGTEWRLIINYAVDDASHVQ